MAKRKSFWTITRLRELDRLFKTYTLRQLERHFGKRGEDIIQAYEYFRMHKRLKITSKTKRGKRVTMYKPGYAEGSFEGRAYRNEELF